MLWFIHAGIHSYSMLVKEVLIVCDIIKLEFVELMPWRRPDKQSKTYMEALTCSGILFEAHVFNR